MYGYCMPDQQTCFGYLDRKQACEFEQACENKHANLMMAVLLYLMVFCKAFLAGLT